MKHGRTCQPDQRLQHVSIKWDTEVFPNMGKQFRKPHTKIDVLSIGEWWITPNAFAKWEATGGNESPPGLHWGKAFCVELL